jgi:hypothetical protein
LITNRNRIVSVNMLVRMLVPKPKNAFQSPGVNSFGLNPVVDVVDVIARSPPALRAAVRSMQKPDPADNALPDCCEQRLRRDRLRPPAQIFAIIHDCVLGLASRVPNPRAASAPVDMSANPNE